MEMMLPAQARTHLTHNIYANDYQIRTGTQHSCKNFLHLLPSSIHVVRSTIIFKFFLSFCRADLYICTYRMYTDTSFMMTPQR